MTQNLAAAPPALGNPRMPRRRPGLFARAGTLLGIAALLLTGCSPLDALDRLEPSDGYRLAGDIAYGPAARHRLDVYMPDLPAAAGQARPVIVFFYGGGWRSGERAGYRFVGRALAGLGFVAIVADYRLFPAVRFPAFVEDGALALRWARDNAARYGGDPRRLFVMGHSAGAYNAIMLASDPRYLAAVGMAPRDLAGAIGLAGPYAFDPLSVRSTRPIFEPAAGSPDTARPVARIAALPQPAGAPPMLLLHGRADTTVAPWNTERMAAALRARGSRADTAYYDGVGHIGLVLEFSARLGGRTQAAAAIKAFVDGLR